MSCPDIYLNLDNNHPDSQSENNKSTGFSPSKPASSSRTKTEGQQRMFSNNCLDDPFLAPEMMFNKFQDHTAAIDVWAFGMIMYCVLFGCKPASYYHVYKEWFKKSHNGDVEMQHLPFVPPSSRNFLYDPFSVDFEMPFDKVDYEEIVGKTTKAESKFAFGENCHLDINGDFNFGNFMKCIKNLSYSSMFADNNSKKFCFHSLTAEEVKEQIRNMPRFAGQETKSAEIRKKLLFSLAQATVLSRKNELGLILDVISSCLDIDPKKRPTINGLLHSPLLKMDLQEQTNAVRFSQNVVLYRSPQSSVSLRITDPLRMICQQAIQNPLSLYDREEIILKMFAYTEDCITYISSMPIEEINSVLTENERRKGLLDQTLRQFRGKDFSSLRVSPNSPLAAQVVEDRVVDMLLFVTFRYLKNFNVWKQKKLKEIEGMAQTLEATMEAQSQTKSKTSKSAGGLEGDPMQTHTDISKLKINRTELLKK